MFPPGHPINMNRSRLPTAAEKSDLSFQAFFLNLMTLPPGLRFAHPRGEAADGAYRLPAVMHNPAGKYRDF